MQANTAQALTQVLSKERVHAYRGKPAQRISDDQLFARYAWNMAISESLYPSLQLLEVTLRNTIHQAASAHFNSEYWFDLSHILQQSHEKDAVLSAKKNSVKIASLMMQAGLLLNLTLVSGLACLIAVMSKCYGLDYYNPRSHICQDGCGHVPISLGAFIPYANSEIVFFTTNPYGTGRTLNSNISKR